MVREQHRPSRFSQIPVFYASPGILKEIAMLGVRIADIGRHVTILFSPSAAVDTRASWRYVLVPCCEMVELKNIQSRGCLFTQLRTSFDHQIAGEDASLPMVLCSPYRIMSAELIVKPVWHVSERRASSQGHGDCHR